MDKTKRAARAWKNVPFHHWHYAREMRKAPSLAEKQLWQQLRGNKLGAAFRRQHPIGPFIVDFFCSEFGIVIEVDGDSHYTDDAQEYDRIRDERLHDMGLIVC